MPFITPVKNLKSKVDVVAMKEAAERGEKHLSAYKNNCLDMQKTLSSFDNVWDSLSSEIFKDLFKKEFEQLDLSFNDFEKYPKELVEGYEVYEKTIGVVVAAAKEVNSIDLK